MKGMFHTPLRAYKEINIIYHRIYIIIYTVNTAMYFELIKIEKKHLICLCMFFINVRYI